MSLLQRRLPPDQVHRQARLGILGLRWGVGQRNHGAPDFQIYAITNDP
jgi:hypothetical protein